MSALTQHEIVLVLQQMRADLAYATPAAGKCQALDAAIRAVRGTPSSRWSAEGLPDPHGPRYDCERAALAGGGGMTDDEVANAVYLDPNIVNLTIAKDRIRWLSRKLASPAESAESAEAYCYEIKWPDNVTTYPRSLPPYVGESVVTPLYTAPPPPVRHSCETDMLSDCPACDADATAAIAIEYPGAAPSGVSDAAVKRAVHVFTNQPSGSYDDGAEERLMRAVLEDFAAQPQPGRDRGMTDCPVPHSKFDPCHNCEPVDWDGTEAHLNYRHQQDKKEK
jgi:hypothetical protein